MKYQMKSIEQLFKDYAFENNRICKEDADVTKRAITNELYRRLKVSLEMLESADEVEAEQICRQFIEP